MRSRFAVMATRRCSRSSRHDLAHEPLHAVAGLCPEGDDDGFWPQVKLALQVGGLQAFTAALDTAPLSTRDEHETDSVIYVLVADAEGGPDLGRSDVGLLSARTDPGRHVGDVYDQGFGIRCQPAVALPSASASAIANGTQSDCYRVATT